MPSAVAERNAEQMDHGHYDRQYPGPRLEVKQANFRGAVARAEGKMKRYEVYHWGMSGIRPECFDSETSDRSVAANVLVREEPDEEEDEEEDDKKENDEDEGYSE